MPERDETRGANPIRRGAFLRRIAAAAGACPLLAAVAEAEQSGFRLLDQPKIKRDFADKRSYKVLFVAHCLLNMNARMHQCANFWPDSVHPIVAFCMEHGIGLVQMGCPETMTMGLGRDKDDPPQEYLRQALEMEPSRKIMRHLAAQTVYQMKEYRFQGFKVLGVIGSEGSPSCGVTTTHDLKNEPGQGQGVYIEELRAQMKEAGLDIPVLGNLDGEEEKTLAWLKSVDSEHK
ncbi:2-thiouracil desulfurase family protein [bacterium]|nr:2-thiouracil desulfurase family protein [bacterium]